MGRHEKDKDYYSILGADDEASQEELERCYKRLAARHHPDRGGDEERMKALNEAYGVLGKPEARRAYDADRKQTAGESTLPASSSPAYADAVSGHVAFALLALFGGLVLLLLVRVHFFWFLWPLLILSGLVILFGVWMAHAALVFARAGFSPKHPARRYVWAQETAFWSIIVGAGYGIYLLLSAVAR